MTKQKEQLRRKAQQKSQSRWLMAVGIALLVIAGLWFVFSNRPVSNLQARPISKLSTADFHSLAFSLTEPETVYFGHHGGLLVSQNGGKDWEETTLENVDAMSLALPPSDPDIMYAAGHNVFFKSPDGGKTWDAVPAKLPGLDIHAFAANPENAAQVVAYVVSFGLFRSDDGGITWQSLFLRLPTSINGLAFGKDEKTLYAAAGGAGLWESKDGGQNWTAVQNTPDNGAIAVRYVREDGRLYVTTLGNSPGLYVSRDNGQSWEATQLKGIILAITISPLDPDHVIAVNDQGEVFASRDGGLSLVR